MRAKPCLKQFGIFGAVGVFAAMGAGLAFFSERPVAADATNWCSPMADGGSRLVTPQMPHGGALSANYRLTAGTDSATGKRVYEASLNLDFHPNTPDVPSSALSEMAERFNLCFSELGPIQGPGGELLKVRLAQASDPGPMPNPTHVDVLTSAMPREERSNLWSITSGCPLIIHETMHLLGLVDLYPETGIGFNVDAQGKWTAVNAGAMYPADNCRSTASDGSVMTDKMIDIVDGTKPEFYNHYCGCETSKCAAELDRLTAPPDVCPGESGDEGTPSLVGSQFEMDTNPSQKAAFEQDYEAKLNGVRVNRWIYEYTKPEPPTVQTILYPAEFRAITEPGCESANHLYYQCTKNAYQTTADRVPPEDRKWQTTGCLNVPDECKNNSLSWLTQ